MAENTKIEWATHTLNPWTRCTPLSPACDNCYAETLVRRFAPKNMDPELVWGPKADRIRTSPANWNKVRTWDQKAKQRSVRDRVFVASLADVFDNHKSIQQEWRDDLWALIRDCQNLDFLLLTKRPQNIERYLPDDWADGYPNVWLGTTVENQEEADRRIPKLLETPAPVHFLSCEPLLGPVNLFGYHHDYLKGWTCEPECCGQPVAQYGEGPDGYPVAFGEECCGNPYPVQVQTHAIGWVICGGESASDDKRRDLNPSWARSLRDQCQAADVPFLFKQHSGRNQPHIKSLGRALDGVEHNGYPKVAA